MPPAPSRVRYATRMTKRLLWEGWNVGLKSLLEMAASRQALGVPIAVPIGFLECEQLLVVVAHSIFLRHADATVQLDTLAAHDSAGLQRHQLGRRNDRAAHRGVGVQLADSAIQDGAYFLHL